ncbi:hypothetical protein ACOKV8_000549 [Vibrio parahaemolyticus]
MKIITFVLLGLLVSGCSYHYRVVSSDSYDASGEASELLEKEINILGAEGCKPIGLAAGTGRQELISVYALLRCPDSSK